MRSARDVLVRQVDVPAIRPRLAGVGADVRPSGTRLIASTPQAMPASIAPAAMSPATRCAACWAEPHWASSVSAARRVGQPGVQPGRAGDVVGLLAGLRDAAAEDLLDLARVDAGPFDDRRWAAPSSSGVCSPDSQPPRLPIGVRTASTITGYPRGLLTLSR